MILTIDLETFALYRLWRDETLYQILTPLSNPLRSSRDFDIWPNDLEHVLHVALGSGIIFTKFDPSTFYPCLNCDVFLMLIRYVTLWSWPWTLTSWPWTFTALRCHAFTLCTKFECNRIIPSAVIALPVLSPLQEPDVSSDDDLEETLTCDVLLKVRRVSTQRTRTHPILLSSTVSTIGPYCPLSNTDELFRCAHWMRHYWDSVVAYLDVISSRGVTTAEKLSGTNVWVPTPGRPLPLWESVGITPGKFLKTQMLNPAIWWLLCLLVGSLGREISCFLKTTAKNLGDQYIVVPKI